MKVIDDLALRAWMERYLHEGDDDAPMPSVPSFFRVETSKFLALARGSPCLSPSSDPRIAAYLVLDLDMLDILDKVCILFI